METEDRIHQLRTRSRALGTALRSLSQSIDSQIDEYDRHKDGSDGPIEIVQQDNVT